jgi:hypothetical protein
VSVVESAGLPRTPTTRALAPAALVALFVCALWVALGVSVLDIVLFLAYELGFVVVPGVALTAALMRRRFTSIEALSIGVAVGYAIEILVATGSSAAGHRNLLLPYPAVALAAALIVRTRWPRTLEEERHGGVINAWGVALVCVAVLSCVAAGYMIINPLPGSVAEAAYSGDTMYLLSIAGEAKHHWPITDPTVSGLPLHYHKFAMIDMAAISRVTGIQLPVLILRLYYVPLLLLLVLQLAWAAGRRMRWPLAGAVAAAFALFVGEFDLTPTLSYPFLDVLSVNLVFAPSILSYVFFVPLVVLLGELLSGKGGAVSVGLSALLLIGAAGSKGGTVLPVVVGAVALVFAWRLVVRRFFDWRSALALALLAVFSGAVYEVVYHRNSQGVSFAPFKSFAEMRPLHVLAQTLPNSLGVRAIYWVPAFVLGCIGAVGLPAAAVAAELARCRSRLPRDAGWLTALFVASVVPLVLFDQPGLSQVQSLPYGRMAAAILVVPTIRGAGSLIASKFRTERLVVGVTGLAVACAFLVWLPIHHAFREGQVYAIQYGCIIVGVALVAWIAWRRGGRLVGGAAVLLAAMLVSSVNTPADAFPTVAQRAVDHQAVYPFGGRDVTRDLYVALLWVRDHSRPADVLAVNNPYVGTDGTGPFNFDYSALAERRVFLEGWVYNERALAVGYHRIVDLGVQPFPRRYALNEAAFTHASRSAIRTMARQYGVRLLFFDKVAGTPPPGLRKVARPVFVNDAAEVFAVRG